MLLGYSNVYHLNILQLLQHEESSGWLVYSPKAPKYDKLQLIVRCVNWQRCPGPLLDQFFCLD